MAKSKKPAAKNNQPSAAKPQTSANADAVDKAAVDKAATDAAPSKDVSSPAASTSSAASQAAAAKSAPAKSTASTAAPAKPAAVKPSGSVETSPATDAVKETPKASPPKTDAPVKPAQTATPATSVPPQPPKRDAAPVPQERRGGFVPLLLGGLIAGGIGFFAAQNDWFSAPDTTTDTFAADIRANAERLTALETAEVDLSGIDLSAIDTLTAQVDGLSATLAEIDARLTVVEQRPAGDGGPSVADQTAFEKELEALKASAEEQRAEIAALLENAQSVEQATAAAAQAAQVQSAVSQITAAMGTGQPFADTLATLTDSGIDVPATLSDVAADGVATLTNLQSRFPDAARAALGVARTTGAMEGESGLGGFLKRQLGARSTQPREGSDPDAVLSRAEAAVRDGGLDTALTEIDTLPQDVQSALQGWLDDARARSAAETATQDLSQSLPAN